MLSTTSLAYVVAILTLPVPSIFSTVPVTSPLNVIVLVVFHAVAVSALPVTSPVTLPSKAPLNVFAQISLNLLALVPKSRLPLEVGLITPVISLEPLTSNAPVVPAPIESSTYFLLAIPPSVVGALVNTP